MAVDRFEKFSETALHGEIKSDDSVLVEIFNDYFTNVAVKLKEPLGQTDFTKLRDFNKSNIPEDISFELPEIREHFVFTFLSSLDTSKATGLYCVGPRLLKLSTSVTTKSIKCLVRKYFSSGIFPAAWKQAKVTPLYKGGSKDDINNYHSIFIPATLSELVETFIHKHLTSYLNNFEVIHQSQIGFRKSHSTETCSSIFNG